MKRAALLVAALALTGCAATGTTDEIPADESAYLFDLLALDGMEDYLNSHPQDVQDWQDEMVTLGQNFGCNPGTSTDDELLDALALGYGEVMTAVPDFGRTLIESSREHLC